MPMHLAGKVLRVAIDIPLRKTFDYKAPEDWTGPDLIPGMRLRVPFGNKFLTGVLLGIHDEAPEFKLKTFKAVIDNEPLLHANLLDLLHWAAGYYCHPAGEVVFTALPALLKQGKPACLAVVRRWLAANNVAGSNRLSRAPKQSAILEYLAQQPEGFTEAEIGQQFVNWRQPMLALAEKGLVTLREERSLTPPVYQDAGLQLNEQQQQAITSIADSLNQFACFLLYGVTGSGKTEVYIQLARQALEQGRQVLILVPEIGLTPQLATRFLDRFRSGIAILHSGLNDSERTDAWLSARAGEASIIIGTRSAVFVPMQSPGLIIIDEEHDPSFKQMEGFRYSARDVAIKRASMLNIPVVLGSATPSLETLNNTLAGRFSMLKLPERAGVASHPEQALLNLQGIKPLAGLSPKALMAIEQELEHGGQALIFLNRRGYAPTYRCNSCGWVAECHHCDVRLTLHQRDARLRCHICSYETSIPEQCPDCGAQAMHSLGHGTEKLETALQQRFPDTQVIRVDRDTTRRKGSFERIIKSIHAAGRQILVGTQMLAKGHHFPRVGTVIILDADNGLYGLDFRSQETMAQLITQVAGRAGRGSRRGQVLIQTWHPEHPFFEAISRLSYDDFACGLLHERKLVGMPPVTYLALLRAESNQMDNTEKFMLEAARTANQQRPEAIEILGPAIAPLERKAGFFRMQLLIKSNNRADLHAFLNPWIHHLDTIKQGRRVRWSIDVDPYNLY